MTTAELMTRPLNKLQQLYAYGYITGDQVREYIKAWNEGPCRFCRAEFADGAIRLTVRD